MPKGIPNATRPHGPTPPVLRINLRAEDYDRLQELARDNYRTTELQAGYMLMKMLEAAAATANGDTAEAILARAKAKRNEQA